ncbi:unnamed protein product [Protopolystoma xenopodis]|uniref:Uncharacterized protein n=1 Tax=Protopolystoma xenopodis TaxID=117903 RepID=A0A448XJK6_9PLAT|nr:unnamed protein product [Protopolystoma xenopodis]
MSILRPRQVKVSGGNGLIGSEDVASKNNSVYNPSTGGSHPPDPPTDGITSTVPELRRLTTTSSGLDVA